MTRPSGCCAAPSAPPAARGEPAVIEELSAGDCLATLGPRGVGRYVTDRVDGAPFLPVAYRVDGDAVALLVPAGHVAGAAAEGGEAVAVTLVAHGQGADVGAAWVVSVRGRLVPVTGGRRRSRLERSPSPWGGEPACGRWFELRSPCLEGRRLRVAGYART